MTMLNAKAATRDVAGGAAVTLLGGITRDIARGGLAGVVVGILAGGVGGRLVMRLATLLVPGSTGLFTENGNRIGEITLSGSLAVVVFGAFAGLVAATMWVVVSPWIPGAGVRRAVYAMPVAVALGGVGLIEGDNRDFSVLGHDALVVALLISLVAVIGCLFAVVDDWLDRRLPIAAGPAAVLYAWATALGVAVLVAVVIAYFTAPQLVTVLSGVALVGVGLATLGAWVVRFRNEPQSAALILAGRGALAVAVVLGFVRLSPEVSRALGMH